MPENTQLQDATGVAGTEQITNTPPEGTGSTGTAAPNTEVSQPQDPNDFAHWEQIIAGDPALSAKARAMQADYTRKMEEIKRARELYQGVPTQDLPFWQGLYQLDQRSRAAELRRVADGLDPRSNIPADPGYTEDGDYVDPGELALREINNFKQQAQRQQEQAIAVNAVQAFQAEDLGRNLTQEEIVLLDRYMAQNGYPLTMTRAAAREFFWQDLQTKFYQKGIQEGETVGAQKATMPLPPGSTTSLPSTPSSIKVTDTKSAVDAAYAKYLATKGRT